MQKHALRWFIVSVGFVILGSLYPFRFRDANLNEAVEQWISMPRTSKSDLAINVIAGLPIGFLGVLALAGNRGNRVRLVIVSVITLGLSTLLSSTVEIAQHWVPSRVASRFDTIAQVCGSGVGITIAALRGKWIGDRVTSLASATRERNAGPLLDLYLFGYLLFMLQPFVPAISPTELWGKWKSGAIEPIPFRIWAEDFWGAAYTVIVCVATAMPIGVWFASRFARVHWQRVTLVAVATVVFLEAAQALIEMRSCSADDAFWSAFGAFAGVIAKQRFGDRLATFIERNDRAFWVTCALAFSALYLIASLAPFDFVTSTAAFAARLEGLRSNPLGLRGNDFASGSNLFRAAIWSATLGVLIGLAFWRRVGVTGRGLAMLFAAATPLLAEAGQLVSLNHSPNLLSAAVRAAASIGALLVYARTYSVGQSVDSSQLQTTESR